MRCKVCGERIFECVHCGRHFVIGENIICDNEGYPVELETVHYHPDCDERRPSSVVIE